MRERCGERKKKKNEERRMKSEEREREGEDRERTSVVERSTVGTAPAASLRVTICIVVLSPRNRNREGSQCISVMSTRNGSHLRADPEPLPLMLHRDSETALLYAKCHICPPRSQTSDPVISPMIVH